MEEPQSIEVRLFTGEEIFRPIWEEQSAPLEVQLGCAWHRCKFCDFANDERKLFSPFEIEAKAQLLSYVMPEAQRVFLLGEYTVKGHFSEQKQDMLAAFDKILSQPGGESIPPVPTKTYQRS